MEVWVACLNHGGPARGHDTIPCVKILLADRVKFVVVTTSAGNRDPLKCFLGYIDLIVRESNQLFQGISGCKSVEYHPQLCRANG